MLGSTVEINVGGGFGTIGIVFCPGILKSWSQHLPNNVNALEVEIQLWS